MATHALHILSMTDKIICLRRGKVVETGTFKELVGSEGTGKDDGDGTGYLARMIKDYGLAKESEDDEEGSEKDDSEISEAGTAQVEVAGSGEKAGVTETGKEKAELTTADSARKQFTDEEKYSGAVSLTVWVKYFKRMGGAGMLFSCQWYKSRVSNE